MNKIKKERQNKTESNELPSEKLNLHKNNNHIMSESEKLSNLERDLDFFQDLLSLIQSGATGFELAYYVESHHYIKKLINDGILFYNTFIEIGENEFLKAPDTKKVDFKSFKTIEDTEKHVFMIWINDQIAYIEKALDRQRNYMKYKEMKMRMEPHTSSEKCGFCGAVIKDRDQRFCEICGSKLD